MPQDVMLPAEGWGNAGMPQTGWENLSRFLMASASSNHVVTVVSDSIPAAASPGGRTGVPCFQAAKRLQWWEWSAGATG